jgi:hypothetical protein
MNYFGRMIAKLLLSGGGVQNALKGLTFQREVGNAAGLNVTPHARKLE